MNFNLEVEREKRPPCPVPAIQPIFPYPEMDPMVTSFQTPPSLRLCQILIVLSRQTSSPATCTSGGRARRFEKGRYNILPNKEDNYNFFKSLNGP